MAVEVNYLFKSKRPPCRWEHKISELINTGVDGSIELFKPADINIISNDEEKLGNVFVEQNNKPMWGRLIQEDGSFESVKFITPIILEPGQVLQIYDRYRSISVQLSDILLNANQ